MVRPLAAASVLACLLLAPRAAWALDASLEPSDESCTQVSEALSVRALGLAPHDVVPLEEGSGVPWCVTPDDPRCSPLDGGPLPSQVSAQPKLSLAEAVPTSVLRGVDVLPWSEIVPAGHLRVGDQVRLERPPRRA
jgi:hypothetical protein